MPHESPEFIRLLTASQNSLLAFILSLLPDHDAAQDVLQETNELLWRKSDDFTPGSNFLSWACTVARYKVLEHQRAAGKQPLVFSDALLEQMADEGAAEADNEFLQQQLKALAHCLGQLTAKHRQLIEKRYQPGASVAHLAAEAELSPRGLSVTLCRIRKSLLECIQNKLRPGVQQ